MMDNIREKLVELLFKVQDCGEKMKHLNGSYAFVERNDNRTIADHLIANGVTVQEWIPVTEKLPKEDGFVIVWHDETEIALFSEGKFCFYDAVGCLREYVEVTHWMPLPTPPKGE